MLIKYLKTLAFCFGFGLLYFVVLFVSAGILLISAISDTPHITGSEVSTQTILIPGIVFIVGIGFFSFLQYKLSKSILGQKKNYISFILILVSLVVGFLVSQVLGIKID